MDNPQREITTSHVFNTKQQRQYPQTRRVVYTPARGRKKYSMSTSPYGMDQFDEELEMYDRRRLGSTGHSYSGKSSITPPPSWSNQIVQEVSLSYSAPLTISPTPHDVPLKIHVSQGNRMDDYGNINSAGSLQDYLSQYESKVSKHRPVQSLERVDNRGRFETEFPVRISYIGGETVSPPPTHSVPIVPIGFPVKSYDSRSHNHRSSSGLSDTIISETTTIEEMTTITTTNQRRSHQQMTPSPTNVNALAQQFEQTARREYIDAQRNRKAAQSPSGTRVVVITKPGPDYVYSSDEGVVHRVEKSAYSPADKKSVVTTTVVDIEPPGYRSRSPRYMEERYQVQEEYRSVKTYPSLERKRPEREHVIVSPTYGSRTEVIEENIRERVTYSRSSSPVMEPEQEQSRGSTPVRSVVEQFESRIEADNRKPKSTVMTSSLDEYSINRKEVQEKPKAVFIPRGESLSTREGSRDEITVERTTTPVPPRTVEAEPVSPVEEKYSPGKEKSPAKVQLKSRTDTNIRLNAYEEITTTTQKVGPKTEERKQEELKNEEMNSGSASGGTSSAMHSSSSYSSKTVSGGAQVSGSISTGGAHSGGAQMSEYSSTISSRPAFNRTVHSSSSTTAYGAGAHSGGRSLLITESASLSGLSPFGQNAASSIRDAREREKKEMSDLNDRLASYIEKVRFLEAQNRKLATDLEMLQGRWGSDTTSVRVMYESELKTAKVVIEESNRQRDALEVEIRRLMTELTEYRKKYEDAVTLREGSRNEADGLLARLGEIEAEINLVKRRIVYVEEEVARIKRENQRLMGELSRHRTVIEQESLNRIDFQNQVQTLLEECQYVGRVHTSELGDLVVMAHRDTTPENREFFKHELASAIRDIRAEYDQISNATRSDMESWYKLKVQEITTHSSRTNMEQTYAREEVKKLRVTLSEMRSKLADLEGRNVLLEKQIQELNYQLEDDQRSYEAALNDRDSNIRKMREECQALMVELQMLLDTKQTLDAEIAIYRKMLEGEENRAGLRQLVEQVVKTTSYSQDHAIESTRVLKSESSSRSNFQTSSKGNVSIHEISPDGRFIIIENTHRSKEENIGEWKLKRRVDGKKENVYVFPKEFVLKPLKSVKVFARGQGVHSAPDSLVFDGDENWGTGSSVQTFLYNKDGEERATHIQRHSVN